MVLHAVGHRFASHSRRRPPPPALRRTNGNGRGRRLHRHRPASRFRRRHGDRGPRRHSEFSRRRLHQLDRCHGPRRTSLRSSCRWQFRSLRRPLPQFLRGIHRSRRILARTRPRHRCRNDRRCHLHVSMVSCRTFLRLDRGFRRCASRDQSAQRRLVWTRGILALHDQGRDHPRLHRHRRRLVARRPRHNTSRRADSFPRAFSRLSSP